MQREQRVSTGSIIARGCRKIKKSQRWRVFGPAAFAADVELAPEPAPEFIEDEGDGTGAGFGGAAGDGVVAAGALAGALEQQAGRGAETPAIPEPRPNFCNEGASSLPLGSSPLADWNFCIASTVPASHLPFGSPW